MSKVLSFLLFVLVIQVLGHGWLFDPIPRGFVSNSEASASTSGPCGIAGNYNGTLNVSTSDFLTVTWTIGGGHDNGAGPRMCRFSIAATDNNQATFDSNIVATGIPCTQGNAQSTTIPIISDLGINYLQFNWLAGDGGSWYNCVRLSVTKGTDQINILTYDAPNFIDIEDPTNVSRIIYNSVPLPPILDAFQHILIRFNQTSDTGVLNVTADDVIPRTYTSGGAYKTAQSFIQTLTVCNIAAQTPTVYVSLFPSIEFQGNATVSVKVYEAELDFNDRQTIDISVQAGETYLYYSQAYSETFFPRRIVIVGRGGNAYMSGPYTNCNVLNKIVPRDPNYCIDLPAKGQNVNQKYYYQTYFDNAYDGRVMVQRGLCSEFSGVSTILVSLMMLIAVLFI